MFTKPVKDTPLVRYEMRTRYVAELFSNNPRKKNAFFPDRREKNCLSLPVVKRKNMHKVHVVYVEGEGKNNARFCFIHFL